MFHSTIYSVVKHAYILVNRQNWDSWVTKNFFYCKRTCIPDDIRHFTVWIKRLLQHMIRDELASQKLYCICVWIVLLDDTVSRSSRECHCRWGSLAPVCCRQPSQRCANLRRWQKSCWWLRQQSSGPAGCLAKLSAKKYIYIYDEPKMFKNIHQGAALYKDTWRERKEK